MATKNYKNNYESLTTFDKTKAAVLDFSKKFYPDDWKNFENNHSGGVIVDAFSFIGDMLHFTQGQYYNQGDISTVTDKQKSINLAQFKGFKNVGPSLSWASIEMTISVSAIGGAVDTTHIPKILPGATIYASDHSVPNFVLANKVEFTKVPSSEWTKIYNTDGTLKRVEITAIGFASSYTVHSMTHTISTSNGESFEKFYEFTLPNENLQQIIEIKDQNGNKYYEVDHLIQDTVFEYVLNDNDVQDNIPYLIFEEEAKYRFIRKQVVTDEKIYSKLVFGNISETNYQQGLFNVNPVDLILPAALQGVDDHSAAINQLQNRSYDPENMLLIDSLGVGPSNNDVLSVKYITGDGSTTKALAGQLNRIRNVTWSWDNDTQSTDVQASLSVANSEPSVGGKKALTVEEIKHYAQAAGLSQKRCVTPPDYLGVILSMPEYLGKPSKVYATRSESSREDAFKFNVFMVDVDSTGYYFDPTKNAAFIHNMRLYLKKYKGLNDTVVLKSGKVINIKVEFDITIDKSFPQNEVSFNTLKWTKKYFNKDNWLFGQTIDVNDFFGYVQKNVDGLLSVNNLKIRRPFLAGTVNSYPMNTSTQELSFDYKKNQYEIPGDSIIEVRYMDDDIIVHANISK
jgi:hypothetical protein